MAVGWPFPPEETPQLVAGVLMALLGAGVLALGFRARLDRALALYLALAATREILGALDDPVAAPLRTVFVFGTIPWFDIAVLFAALHLAVRYAERESGRRSFALASAGILVVALLAELAFFLTQPTIRDPAAGYSAYLGHPAILAYAALPPLLAWCAVAFVRRAARETDAPRRRGYRLAAIAFSCHAAFAPAIAWRYFYAIAGLEIVPLALLLSSLVPLALVGKALAPAQPHETWRPVLFLGAIAGSALAYVAWASSAAPPAWVFPLADGLVRIVLPVLLTYSILRHRLFDIDVRIRATVARSALAAVFVAVFFVVAEVAQGFFTESLGWVVGGVATGLLVFALAPLQRVAERIGHAAMPHARPTSELAPAERLDLFRGALRDAWHDGALDASERRMLEGLRRRLDISHADAARVEDEVLGQA